MKQDIRPGDGRNTTGFEPTTSQEMPKLVEGFGLGLDSAWSCRVAWP